MSNRDKLNIEADEMKSMDEPGIKALTTTLSHANCFALSWTWLRCQEYCFAEYGNGIFHRECLEHAAHLLVDAWKTLVEEHPTCGNLNRQRSVLEGFAFDLCNLDHLVSEDEVKELAEDSRYRDKLGLQDNIDIKRVDKGEPVLLPDYFPEEYSLLLPESPRMKYERVSSKEYQKAYKTPFRWIFRGGGYKQQIMTVDRHRQEKGEPILLPFGLRLNYPGLSWNDKRKCSLPYGADDNDAEFEIHGVRYRYVKLDTFIREYGLPARVDTVPVRVRIACDFTDTFLPLVRFLEESKAPGYTLAQAISTCVLDDPVIAVLDCHVIPNNMTHVIESAGLISPCISESIEKWIAEQRSSWIQHYRERAKNPNMSDPIVLSWVFFKQVYSILRKFLDTEALSGENSIQHFNNVDSQEIVEKKKLSPDFETLKTTIKAKGKNTVGAETLYYFIQIATRDDLKNGAPYSALLAHKNCPSQLKSKPRKMNSDDEDKIRQGVLRASKPRLSRCRTILDSFEGVTFDGYKLKNIPYSLRDAVKKLAKLEPQ